MDNVKGVLLILALLLAGTTFVLFLQASTAKARVQDAELLSAATKEFLLVQGKRCGAAPEQFKEMAACIAPLLQAKDFKEDAFKQPKDGEPGYLVIQNVNRRAYDASGFTFQHNRVERQIGCDIPGEVGYEVTCRFALADTCEKGDILEVFYGGTRVFLKTC